MSRTNGLPAGVGYKGGGCYTLPDGSTVRGRDAVVRALAGTGGAPAERSRTATGVAIVGFTDSRKHAPTGDDGIELWGLNALHRMAGVDPADYARWFDLHDRSVLEDRHPEHLAWLKTAPMPVYMQRAWADIPASVAFPKARVEARFGTYMTSSIAWMLGLALLEGADPIHVYGVDMASDTEYAQQRPAVEYLLGVAKGMGRTVYVPESSDLLQAHGQYGWRDSGPFRAKIRERRGWAEDKVERLKQKKAGLQGEVAQINAAIQQLRGVLDDLDYWERTRTFPSGENGRPDTEA